MIMFFLLGGFNSLSVLCCELVGSWYEHNSTLLFKKKQTVACECEVLVQRNRTIFDTRKLAMG